jgi:hypothetical protein
LPFRISRFRLNRRSSNEVQSLRDTLYRESRRFGTSVGMAPDSTLDATWDRAA